MALKQQCNAQVSVRNGEEQFTQSLLARFLIGHRGRSPFEVGLRLCEPPRDLPGRARPRASVLRRPKMGLSGS